MSSKAACIEAIEKIGGKLEHDDIGNSWTTQLIAPTGCHWSEVGYHAIPVHWFITPSLKPEYWGEVLAEIRNLGEAEPCVDSGCNEWSDDYGCGVWAE